MSAGARRAAFVVLAGMVLSQAAPIVSGLGNLVAARLASSGTSILLAQGVVALLAWALSTAVLVYAVAKAGEPARDRAASVGLLVVVVVVGLLAYPIGTVLYSLSSLALVGRMAGEGTEDLARVIEQGAYLQAGLGVLTELTHVAIAGWAWARWSAAARAAAIDK